MNMNITLGLAGVLLPDVVRDVEGLEAAPGDTARRPEDCVTTCAWIGPMVGEHKVFAANMLCDFRWLSLQESLR